MTILLNAITTAASTAAAVSSQVIKLQSPPGAGSSYAKRTFQAIIRTTTGSVAGTATIAIQVSNEAMAESNTPDAAAWITLGTISVTGTVSTTVNATDGFASDANWRYVRGYIAQNGVTGANVVATLIMGA